MRLTYSNVTATVALFVALGGTSYAITKLPRDSVGSSQIRDRSVQPIDLAAGAVAPGLRGPRGSEGPKGNSGAQGPQGNPGTQGPAGATSARIAPQAPNVNLSGTANSPVEVRRMNNVPAGKWLLRFDANALLGTGLSVLAYCQVKVNGDQVAVSAAVVGQTAPAVQEVGVPVETAVDRAAPFNVTVECRQDQNSSPPVVIVRPQIIATQVSELVTAP